MANYALGGVARNRDSWVVKTEQPDSPLTLELNVSGMDGASLSVDMDREHVLALVNALQEVTSVKDAWVKNIPGGWADGPESVPLVNPEDVKPGDYLMLRGDGMYSLSGVVSFVVDNVHVTQSGKVVWESCGFSEFYAREWEVLEWKPGYSD